MADDGANDYEEGRGSGANENRRKKKSKGRGHARMDHDRYDGRGGVFERIEQEATEGPAQSIEGWIVFVTGVHEEAQEDDILDRFSEYGDVKNIHVNLDRRTGFVKGYALIEYESKDEAAEAIEKMNGQDFLGKTLTVDWAFMAR